MALLTRALANLTRFGGLINQVTNQFDQVFDLTNCQIGHSSQKDMSSQLGQFEKIRILVVYSTKNLLLSIKNPLDMHFDPIETKFQRKTL